jgi:hypothetical protein
MDKLDDDGANNGEGEMEEDAEAPLEAMEGNNVKGGDDEEVDLNDGDDGVVAGKNDDDVPGGRLGEIRLT